MPMRVEGASSCTVLTRRSIQRAIQTLTTTKIVTSAKAFSTDQIVMRVAPLERPMESSASTMASSHPSICTEMSAQMMSVRRSSQVLMRLLLPIDSRSRNASRRISASAASSVQAMSSQPVGSPARASGMRATPTIRRPTRKGATTASASVTSPRAPWPFSGRPRYQRRPSTTPTTTTSVVSNRTASCTAPACWYRPMNQAANSLIKR